MTREGSVQGEMGKGVDWGVRPGEQHLSICCGNLTLSPWLSAPRYDSSEVL
jgi:hypothetical protein